MHKGELNAAKAENLKLETVILAVMGSSSARSHDMPADIYTKGFPSDAVGTGSLAGAGSSTDYVSRTTGTRLRGI